jgi:hypothetical protein
MAKNLLWIFGVVFLVVGALGWVPNPIVGMGAIFETNHAHDLFHLVIGALFVFVAMSAIDKAALTLKAGGAVYLLVAVLGFMMVPKGGALLGLIQTNVADHWLHVVLGAALLAAGFMTKSEGNTTPV